MKPEGKNEEQSIVGGLAKARETECFVTSIIRTLETVEPS